MTVVWSRRAVQHLIQLGEHIAQDSLPPPRASHSEFWTASPFSPSVPPSGGQAASPATRELVVPQTPCVLPYRVRGNTLGIIAVFHQRQRWPDRL